MGNERVDAAKKKATKIQEAIRDILYKEWDPIGVRDAAPEDEYDSYIGGVYRILVSSRAEQKLIEYLAQAETQMGMGSAPREHLKQIAQKLLALNVRL